MSNFDRLFKISISHNVTEKFDFHDACKTLLMRILRRRYPNCEIYSEHHPIRTNELYPDIYLRLKNDRARVFELQRSITRKWIEDIKNKYLEEDLIVVPLHIVENRWYTKLRTEVFNNPLDVLRCILEDYT